MCTLSEIIVTIIIQAGQVSYKKVETNALMGSIQLGIHDSVGGLAKYPERFTSTICFLTMKNQIPRGATHPSFKSQKSSSEARTP